MKRARHRFCCHRAALRATLLGSAARTTAKVRVIAPAYSTNVVVALFRHPAPVSDADALPCSVSSYDAQDVVVRVVEAKKSGSSPCARKKGVLDGKTKYIFEHSIVTSYVKRISTGVATEAERVGKRDTWVEFRIDQVESVLQCNVHIVKRQFDCASGGSLSTQKE